MWRRLFRKPSEADLAEELEAHLAIETKQWMDRGLPREQAEMQARRLFGSRALTLEATREVRGMAAFGRFSQDLRYAARVLQRGRAFTFAAVLSLALGIGATTAVFSIYDTIFLRPLPYKDPGQLAWISIHSPSMGIDLVPSPNYVAWRRDNKTFQQLAATQVTFANMMVLGGPNPAEVYAGRVSANFFETFGVVPAAGRTFRPEEELHGPQAAMLTDHFWREHFRARRDVLGTTLTLDGYPFTIVGILPKSFVYPVDVKVDVLFTLRDFSHGQPARPQRHGFLRVRPAQTRRHHGAGAGRPHDAIRYGQEGFPGLLPRQQPGARIAAGLPHRQCRKIPVPAYGRGRLPARHRLRQCRQPAAGAVVERVHGNSPCARPSAPGAGAWPGNCSPKSRC